jgi:hypothetical protein
LGTGTIVGPPTRFVSSPSGLRINGSTRDSTTWPRTRILVET